MVWASHFMVPRYMMRWNSTDGRLRGKLMGEHCCKTFFLNSSAVTTISPIPFLPTLRQPAGRLVEGVPYDVIMAHPCVNFWSDRNKLL